MQVDLLERFKLQSAAEVMARDGRKIEIDPGQLIYILQYLRRTEGWMRSFLEMPTKKLMPRHVRRMKRSAHCVLHGQVDKVKREDHCQ